MRARTHTHTRTQSKNTSESIQGIQCLINWNSRKKEHRKWREKAIFTKMIKQPQEKKSY